MRLLSAGAALVLVVVGWAAAAAAADQVQVQAAGQDGTLVRGGAPLPEFHLNFMLDDPVRQAAPSPLVGDHLEIALTSPSSGVFHFLFSPRPQFGFGYDQMTASNRGFAGVTWSLFDNDRLFGSVGLAGSYDPGPTSPYDPLRRPLGPPLMVHGALELGYQFGQQHSLSLRFDEGHAPDFRLNGENSDNLSLRYGLKF